MNLVEQARDFVEKLVKDKLSSLHNYYNFNLKKHHLASIETIQHLYILNSL